METHNLGPNGGLVYCMDYLEQNFDWLLERLEALQGRRYVLFDFPGQVELYTHGEAVQRLLQRLEKWGCRLTAVHLVDAHHCSDAGKFISAVLISLTTMVRLELPHVNVLSKVDLVESYGRLAFDLNFYTDVVDVQRLLPYVGTRSTYKDPGREGEEGGGREDENGWEEEVREGSIEDGGEGKRDGREAGTSGGGRFARRYRKLNEALCELIEDFSLVAFHPLNIQDADCIERVLAVVDKCNGYLLGAEERALVGREGEAALLSTLSGLAFRAQPDADRVKDVQDRYMDIEDRDENSLSKNKAR
ncbi:gpn-loop gtpase 2 [Nannochloropsis gaditana]|nr:gpn-loop gtpase 2 [Nannochloropsis gaditana]